MADISTGRQRGIVPFVDETTGRLPDQYLPQGVIDLQGDLEQAVTDASASATAAKSSADSATQSASAAAQSAESASGDAAAAKASANEAASSASAAKASETAAASSATAAAESKVAAKASETAAAQSAQTATEQVSSIGDSVERAASSATAAQQSATEAASSASGASQSASSASTSASQAGESASQASGFASTASQAATTATGAASNASASATAAQQSATEASDKADSVLDHYIESATATTLAAGSDATAEVVDKVLKLGIPRGPKGDPGDLTTVAHDNTLTGDGTSGTPLGVADGTAISPFLHVTPPLDMDDVITDGWHNFILEGVSHENLKNAPDVAYQTNGYVRAFMLVSNCGGKSTTIQVWFNRGGTSASAFMRAHLKEWTPWYKFAFTSDIPTGYVSDSELAVMQTRLQALEARVNSLETSQ